MRRSTALLALALLAAACSGEGTAATTTADTVATTPTEAMSTEGCADVVAVSVEAGSAGFNVSATVSSADTGWDKYADLWEVRTRDGVVLGERVLAHPHENEQPFTRSVSGVEIPIDVSEVIVAARDSVAGFCGSEFVAEVPHQ